MVCAAHRFSHHVRRSLAFGNARKVHSGCRWNVPVLRHGQRGHSFSEARQRIAMPDGAKPITALSWAEVQRIVDRFESLNPYDRKLVPGSILKIHKLNWDQQQTAPSAVRLQHCREEICTLHQNSQRHRDRGTQSAWPWLLLSAEGFS